MRETGVSGRPVPRHSGDVGGAEPRHPQGSAKGACAALTVYGPSGRLVFVPPLLFPSRPQEFPGVWWHQEGDIYIYRYIFIMIGYLWKRGRGGMAVDLHTYPFFWTYIYICICTYIYTSRYVYLYIYISTCILLRIHFLDALFWTCITVLGKGEGDKLASKINENPPSWTLKSTKLNSKIKKNQSWTNASS